MSSLRSSLNNNHLPESLTPGAPPSREEGFTLIEIAFAVMILAGSLIVLLGLQSASVARAVRDRSGQEAMLLAREILTAIETRPEAEVLQSASGSVDEVMRDVMVGDKLPVSAFDPEQRYRADLVVNEIEVPVLSARPQKMRRIELRVSWGQTPQDEVSVLYFLGEK